jgi:hypothetical protein
VNESVGLFAQREVAIGWRDGVGFGLGAVSPAVEDDECERFRSKHDWAHQRQEFSDEQIWLSEGRFVDWIYEKAKLFTLS